jgi:ABC-2 type transport system ATP-binding protein
MLVLRDVSKTYTRRQRPAIDGISIELGPSEVVGLVGLNGAGKTTTLRAACGVLLPTRGDIFVDGFSLRSQKAGASRLIGWVPEQPIHDPSARVGSLIRYYSDIAGGVPYSAGDKLLEEWGLDEHVRKKFRELSLGLKRRMAIVVASLTNPKYYLLDEPFNGLDPAAIVRFRKWIRRTKQAGGGVLLSSHNLKEVQSLADRVIVIHRGRLIDSMKVSALQALNRSEVTVVLDRFDSAARVIMEKFGNVAVSGTSATIYGSEIDPGSVNTALVNAGYVVVRLHSGESNFEEYFLKLVGEPA